MAMKLDTAGSAEGVVWRTVQSVSFPRSGHLLLYGLLRKYFGEGFSRCEYYHCCQSVPCKKGAVYQKNHDFELDLSNDPETFHIIQYRRSAQAQLNAYFRFVHFPKQRAFFGRQSERPARPDAYIADSARLKRKYRRFIKKNRTYFEGFVRKWVLTNTNPNTYLLEYADFVAQPLPHLTALIRLLAPAHPVDEVRVATLIDEADIAYKHNLAEDPLYMPDFNERFGVTDVEDRVSGLAVR